MLIHIANGPHAGHTRRLARSDCVLLGRNGPLRVVDSQISRQHARLRAGDGRWTLEDLGSVNGTYLNGQQIKGQCLVHEGDTLRIGMTTLILRGLEQAQIEPMPESRPIERVSVLAKPRPVTLEIEPVPVRTTTGRPQAFWRWLPVAALAVMLLAIGAQAMLYLRARETADDLRAQARRDRDQTEGLVNVIRLEARNRSQSDRATLLREMATFVSDQGDESLRHLDEKLRARLDERQAANEQRLNAQVRAALDAQSSSLASAVQTAIAAAKPAPPEPPASTPAAAIASSPDFLILIDASNELSSELPMVRAEILRELSRFDHPARGRVLLFSGGRRWDFSVELLAASLELPPRWELFLARLRPGAAVDHGVSTLSETLEQAMNPVPPQLFIFAATLADAAGNGPQAARQLLHRLDDGSAARIDVIHFFSREAAEGLKTIAREHRGTYSFIPRLAQGPS